MTFTLRSKTTNAGRQLMEAMVAEIDDAKCRLAQRAAMEALKKSRLVELIPDKKMRKSALAG